jgi:8-oxo-dGTP pyrophosphatase MutT (NUDIX family)
MVAEITVPRPASTVVTVRDAPDGYEVLMLQRNMNSDFVGGAYVFPGGGVDAGDSSPELLGRILGRSEEEARARLSLDSGALEYYVAAVRELFEEAGLLACCTKSGGPIELGGGLRAKLNAGRDTMNARKMTFLEFLLEFDLYIDLRGIEYLAHWVTPEGAYPRRFDTRFFALVAPANQVASHDEGETVDNRWIRPNEALEAHRRGELELIFPTIKNLEAIAHFARAEEVVDFARNKRTIPRIMPVVIERDGHLHIEIPDDL